MSDIDIDVLHEMWSDPTATKGRICRELGVSYDRLVKLQAELGLPDRDAPSPHAGDGPGPGDPTPDEIEARAALIRAEWPESRLAECGLVVDYSAFVFRPF